MNAAQALTSYFAQSRDHKPVWAIFSADGLVLHWSVSKKDMQHRLGAYQAQTATSMWIARVET